MARLAPSQGAARLVGLVAGWWLRMPDSLPAELGEDWKGQVGGESERRDLCGERVGAQYRMVCWRTWERT